MPRKDKPHTRFIRYRIERTTRRNATRSTWNLPPPPPSEPTLRPVDARRYHEEAIKEFLDLFVDKLPPRNQRRINPNAPVHRIELKDPKKTINGRLFALPEKFLNSMIDFLEEHLLAGHIRPSKSQFAAGTWMIPNKDPTAMPRIVGAMQGQRETLFGT